MLFRWKKRKKRNAQPVYEVDASVLTDVGCRRDVNEDCGRYIKPGDWRLLSSKGILALVADGMGGHSAGEVASHIAVDVISHVYYQSRDEPAAALNKAFRQANEEIYRAGLANEDLKGMGTTCTALVLKSDLALFAHIGDSRLYLVRGGEIYLMSEDHSLVMDMVKRGLISLEEARRHSDKNVILRALGVYPKVEISTWEEPFPVRPGDRFLLCSDGLYDLVPDEKIKQVVMSADAHTACQQLIELAKEAGGYDNITVGLLSISPWQGSRTRRVRRMRPLEVAQ